MVLVGFVEVSLAVVLLGEGVGVEVSGWAGVDVGDATGAAVVVAGVGVS